MRVAFINALGGKMLVDESRVEEYKAAGYMLAADVVDTTAIEVNETEEKPKATTKRKATKKKRYKNDIRNYR